MLCMIKNKFTATWVSHSSISDYLACPRAYFLKNVYKNPDSGYKIQVVTPALSLGSAIHEVLEELAGQPTEQRFKGNLIAKYEQVWQKNYAGKKGGFLSEELEKKYFERGRAMLAKIIDKPGPLKNLAVRIKDELPNYYLSEEDDIILCGKLDWLEYFPGEDKVRIIDFKTSTREENPDSLQLPIYYLLAKNCQKYNVSEIAYWYLDKDESPTPRDLPDEKEAREKLLTIAKKIKTARALQTFKCPQQGCQHCEPFEKILAGKGELVKKDAKMRREVYILPWSKEGEEQEEIL